LNLFDCDFDVEKGYQVYNEKNFDILVIKLEVLSMVFRDAFKELLGIEIPKLSIANEGSDKSDSKIISKVKTNFKIPSESIEKVYSSEYVQKFYSLREIETFKKRWSL
jgi:hypothetical protein